MKKYICTICGFVYDEAVGIPSAGIAAGTKWEDLPSNWVCPICGAVKSEFSEQKAAVSEISSAQPILSASDDMTELSVGQLSALCSNLAKGCDKQYLKEESALFTQLADYFKGKAPREDNSSVGAILALVEKDLNEGFVNANAVAKSIGDRGAQRALVWSEKVTRILNSLLSRYENEGDTFLANTNVYVCETCGFVYVGDTPPDICPVCKVPAWKIVKMERR